MYSVIFVNRISEKVSFELSKEIEKDGKHISLFLFLFLSRSFILSFTIDIPLIIEFKRSLKIFKDLSFIELNEIQIFPFSST